MKKMALLIAAAMAVGAADAAAQSTLNGNARVEIPEVMTIVSVEELLIAITQADLEDDGSAVGQAAVDLVTRANVLLDISVQGSDLLHEGGTETLGLRVMEGTQFVDLSAGATVGSTDGRGQRTTGVTFQATADVNLLAGAYTGQITYTITTGT